MAEKSAEGGDLGLTGAVSMALGGMIGGGIYAVLGVVVKVTGALAWLSFVLAGLVAMCAGYSYIKFACVQPPVSGWYGQNGEASGLAPEVLHTVSAITVVAVVVELLYFETDMFGYSPDDAEATAQSD
jgi:amino acid transporter